MRFKSDKVDGFQVFAVSGTNTVSFGITATSAAKTGLLGFAVRRSRSGQPFEDVPGFKVFESIIPKPDKDTRVLTKNHPVQSLVWDDFTGDPDTRYDYTFQPLRGKPGAIDRSATPIKIGVRTEPLFSDKTHDIFFNRGVASSQFYAREFGNKKPSDLSKAKAERALQFLTRDLDEAILKFIKQARKGDTLLGCFYEFRFKPVVLALKDRIDAGVTVEIIIDAKLNAKKDKNGKMQPPFPRDENLAMIAEVGIKKTHIIERDANPSNIQHNKFLVLLKKGTPREVWTGSTNLSVGGFTGQTNVGHWVRNKDVATAFKKYWDVLSGNPGSAKGDAKSVATKKKNAFRTDVEAIGTLPAAATSIPSGVTPVFSPRLSLKALELYIKMADSAATSSCMTLAFGINDALKTALVDNTSSSHIVFLLLEKKDTPNSRSSKPFIVINAKHNVYKAWGSFLRDPVYQWVRETNARELKFNSHVSYIHSKFLLMDPLGDDPIVVTGSANFSNASTKDNDENMLIIRGDRRVADIYFTEFNRLFNHYYFRAVQEATKGQGAKPNLFLDETGKEWQKKYETGKLRAKRLNLYATMKGAVKLT